MITTNFRVLFGNLEFPFSGGINDSASATDQVSFSGGGPVKAAGP